MGGSVSKNEPVFLLRSNGATDWQEFVSLVSTCSDILMRNDDDLKYR